MEKEMVIYQKGETCIQTTVKNGLCDFTGEYKDGRQVTPNLTVEQFLEKHGSAYVCIAWEEALGLIEQRQAEVYLTPWKEISRDEWSQAFCILPPEKYRFVGGIEIFRMMERATGNITAHYARIKDKYFTTHRKTSDDYKDLVREVYEQYTKAIFT